MYVIIIIVCIALLLLLLLFSDLLKHIIILVTVCLWDSNQSTHLSPLGLWSVNS